MPPIVSKPDTPGMCLKMGLPGCVYTCKHFHTEKPQVISKSPQAKVTSSKSLNQSNEEEGDNNNDGDTNGRSTGLHTY